MRVISKPEHEAAYQDICALLGRHAGSVSGVQMLAIAANLVGKMIAMQDQREVTPAQAMQIVALNIENGNAQAVEQLLGETKGNG